MRRSRGLVLLGVLGVVAGWAAACGSSGGVGAGGTCYLATDCSEGLICIGVTLKSAGTCSSNVSKVQPPSDGSFPDAGQIPQSDAPGVDVPTPPDATMDTAPPADTGPADTGPVDTGPPPPDTKSGS